MTTRTNPSTDAERRDWNWDTDGDLDGLYVETRSVIIKNGPSAGQSKLIFDFHLADTDESVSVWETAVLKSKFRRELEARRKPDFEPGERIVIRPTGWKESANGKYRDFDPEFEYAAPKPTTAELLGVGESADDDDSRDKPAGEPKEDESISF
jgi:hypothetical protein